MQMFPRIAGIVGMTFHILFGVLDWTPFCFHWKADPSKIKGYEAALFDNLLNKLSKSAAS